MIANLRLVGIAVGSLVIAALAMALIGSWLPQPFGGWATPLATVILGGRIFQDIVSRERTA